MGNCCSSEEPVKIETYNHIEKKLEQRKFNQKNTGLVKKETKETNRSSQENSKYSEVLSYLPEHIQLIYYSLADFSAESPEWVNKDDLKLKDAKSIPEGGMYQGNWNKETKEREGYGIVVWNDGSLYQGYWKKDQPEGPGRMIHVDGDVFEGTFVQGNLHGKGTYYGEDALQHQGTAQLTNGDQNGNVSQEKGKNKYEGDWNHGMKHGFGVFIWADGSKYEGNFKDDQFNGEGEYTRADGKHYKGTWK